MNLEHLEILEAAFHHGSFGAASKALGKSQPSVSLAIKSLEEELGFDIFDRSSYRPKPTLQGQVFFESVKDVLVSFKKAKRIGSELGNKQVEPLIRITIDPLVRFSIFQTIIDACFVEDTFTNLIVQNSVSEGAMEDLLQGHADLAIGHMAESREEIEVLPYCQVSLVPMVRKSLLEKYGSESELLRVLPQIIVFNRHAPGSDERALPPAKHALSKNIYVTDHSMKARMIHEGLGWGRLRKHEIVQDKLTILSSEVYPATDLNLCLMRNSHRPLGPTGRRIWETFQKHDLKADVTSPASVSLI